MRQQANHMRRSLGISCLKSQLLSVEQIRYKYETQYTQLYNKELTEEDKDIGIIQLRLLLSC